MNPKKNKAEHLSMLPIGPIVQWSCQQII